MSGREGKTDFTVSACMQSVGSPGRRHVSVGRGIIRLEPISGGKTNRL